MCMDDNPYLPTRTGLHLQSPDRLPFHALFSVKVLNVAWDLFCEFRECTVSSKLNTT